MIFITQPWDMKLLVIVNQIMRKNWLDIVMPLISSAALLWVIILAATAYGFHKKGPKFLVIMLVIIGSMGISDFSTGIIKKTIGRVRPVNSVPLTYYREDGKWQRRPLDFKPLKKKGNSYPSAHAANSMAFALMCMFFFRKLRPWMIFLPLSVGYSRLYLGKHFPTDVLAGWVVGTCVAISVWLVWKYLIENRIPDKLRP